jgi:hypothetical protein
VSATFNAGSGGDGCSDDYTVSIDGGAAVAYSPGSTAGASATSSIEIKGRRANCTSGAGCTGTSYATLASWSVVAQPVGPTLLAKTPNLTAICAGQGVSATFNAGSGGVGCSDDYTVSIDSGTATAYTPGSTVGTTATTSIVIKGRRAGCTSGAGCAGTSYTVLASWTINPRPTSVVSGTAAIYYGCSTVIQAALTGTGPWNVTWSDGVTQSGVTASPATRTVSPSITTTYTVTNLTDANCTALTSDRTGSALVTVNPAPSQPSAATYYTGPLFYWTTGPSSSTASLTLTATLKNKLCFGDIRTAKVSFFVRNGPTLTPITGAQNLPVGLVTPGDTSVGTAAATVQYSIGSAQGAALEIAVIVGGNYAANDPTTDATVTIAVPVAGGLICGGGSMDNSNVSGYASGGYLKGSATDPACFSFYVQYSKSGSNPQGGVQIFDRSFNKPDGTTDTVLHTYMFKSTAISTLAVTVGSPTTVGTATFSSKANVVELLPNGTQVSIEGNDVMTLTLTDGATITGNTTKKLAITIQRTKGGTWYSSSWDGTKTVEKQINSGNVSVK